jgi:Effector protein
MVEPRSRGYVRRRLTRKSCLRSLEIENLPDACSSDFRLIGDRGCVILGDVLPGFLQQSLTPHAVGPTPGVNSPVPQPTSSPHDDAPLPPGHWLGDVMTGRADMMTAMLDPERVKDRMKAENELAGRFEIVDGKTKGPRLPNQITSAEFHQLSNTYSDIRLGHGDLTIDGAGAKDPGQYGADIMNDIGDILQTKSGRALVEGLSNSTNIDEKGDLVHRHTTLEPGVDDDGVPDLNLTDEQPADKNSEFGKNILGLDGTPGVGKDTVVRSNPNMDIPSVDATGAASGHGRSDVALFHEMVHAYTDTRGITESGLITADDSFVSAAPLGAIHLQDPDVVADAKAKWPVQRAEYQAAGLGFHKGDLLTENTYRRERTEVAKSGKGIAGDMLMPQRTKYVSTDDDYKTIGGL